ncbi:hypothetical protein [Paenibacillus xanthanilyticus]|uniref:Uncharacterized protein n=1 Tax=Paenibacillus xanthanilyticus TaxID=1783531 RepID=A0ABV8KCI6_9BACL
MMLTYYRYKVDKGMMALADVPNPYQSQLRNMGYTDADAEVPTEG